METNNEIVMEYFKRNVIIGRLAVPVTTFQAYILCGCMFKAYPWCITVAFQ